MSEVPKYALLSLSLPPSLDICLSPPPLNQPWDCSPWWDFWYLSLALSAPHSLSLSRSRLSLVHSLALARSLTVLLSLSRSLSFALHLSLTSRSLTFPLSLSLVRLLARSPSVFPNMLARFNHLRGVPREQMMLKGHLPKVICHQVY